MFFHKLTNYKLAILIQLFIFIISIGFAFITNIININVTNAMYGDNDGILFGSTLSSPDNAWYLNQIVNYVNGFGFTIDPLDPIYSVRRTPGYPIFYGIHYLLLGEIGAHKVITFTQMFLHALAGVCMFRLSYLISLSMKTAFLAAALYGLSPFISSFLYMTITESIFPAGIVFSIYLAYSCFINKSFIKQVSRKL